LSKFIAQYYSWIVLTFAAGTIIAIIILLIFYYQSKKAPFFFLREVAEARVRYAFWSAVALLGITLLLLSSPTRSTPSPTSALAQATDTPTLSSPLSTPVPVPQVQAETVPPELTPTWTPTLQPSSTSTPSPVPTGEAVQGASFSDLVLAAGITSDSKPLNPADTFSVGGKPVYLFFHYEGMSDNITWTQSWYRDSMELYKESTRWQWGLAGRAWIFFAPMGGYTPGEYEVRLYIEDVLQQAARFTVK
jgi:hypothetical protein